MSDELLQDIQHELDNSEWVGDDGTSYGLPQGTIKALEQADARIRELEQRVDLLERTCKQGADNIREQKALLDECERALVFYASTVSETNRCYADNLLSKLRGEQ